jgi:hypothetical protein
LYVGNLSLWNPQENDSGENFLCKIESGYCNFFLKTDETESWSTDPIHLSIFNYNKIEYHTLDKRYLPTDILTSELVNDSLVTYSKY